MSEGLAAALRGLAAESWLHPERLPWLLLIAVAVLALAARGRAPAIAWPAIAEALHAGARGGEPVTRIALALRGLALGCLALALAGPAAVHRAPPEPGAGLDLVLVLDTSGSMRALDTELEHGTRTRLALAREVVARFARERVAEGDRVGLVVFGETAFTQCPLSSDPALLAAALERVSVGMAGEATALGDALGLAIKRASAAGDGAGRVVVLLTDGRSNAGGVPVGVATELARAAEVRIHTVGIGTAGEQVQVDAGASAGAPRFERHDLDTATLRQIAQASGGRFFQATRSRDLDAVYREIDALERVPRVLPPRARTQLHAEPLLAGAGAVLLLEIALARVLRRSLP